MSKNQNDWQAPKLGFALSQRPRQPKYRSASTSQSPTPKRPWRARLRALFTRKRVAVLGVLTAIFLLIVPLLTYAYYARDISDRERLMNRTSTGVILKDRTGQVFYQQGQISSQDEVPLDQISDNLENALIASEDKDFYKHEGFSVRGIAGALYANVLNKDATRYGGSTLTQQLVKNQLLSSEKSYLRKYQELSMAIAVEREYTKQEILEMYLNSVYFGEGAFGIADAAKTYYGKAPADLSVAESALLVGLLPAPNTYSPISGDPELASKQQQRVLTKMQELQYITAAEKTQAQGEQLTYASASGDESEHAQHYAQMVLDQLREDYGEERISRAGFEVTTGLDLNAQKEAEAIVKRRVATFTSGGGKNAGLVAIDPKTGYVQALVGSVDWANEEFGKVNMAVAERQPGSSFKPIYFAEALDKRLITAATILKDERRAFGEWKPENFDFKFKGDMPVRSALAESRNIPAGEVMEKLGPATASKAAQRMGITSVDEPDKYGLTLALGTAETQLYQMTNAYAAFANGGQQFEPVLVTSIQDKYKNTVFQHEAIRPTRVISEDASFVLSSILSDTAARAPTFGSSLNIANRQVAVKTGTTDENKDAWTIGYTPGVAIGVWVGNNESQPMRGLAGGSSAGLIWRDAMSTMTQAMPQERFAVPASVRQVNVCRGSGLRASAAGTNTYSEYFISGTEPRGTCNTQPVEQKPAEKPEDKKREEEPKPEESQTEGQGEQQPDADQNEREEIEDGLQNPTQVVPPAGGGGRGAGGEAVEPDSASSQGTGNGRGND